MAEPHRFEATHLIINTFYPQHFHQPTINNTYDRSTGKIIDSSTHNSNYHNSNHYDKVNFGQPSNSQSQSPAQEQSQKTDDTQPADIKGSEEPAPPPNPLPPSSPPSSSSSSSSPPPNSPPSAPLPPQNNPYKAYGDYPPPSWLQSASGSGRFQSRWQGTTYGGNYHPQAQFGTVPALTNAPPAVSGYLENGQPPSTDASASATNETTA